MHNQCLMIILHVSCLASHISHFSRILVCAHRCRFDTVQRYPCTVIPRPIEANTILDAKLVKQFKSAEKANNAMKSKLTMKGMKSNPAMKSMKA